MAVKLSEQMSLSVDVAILLRRNGTLEEPTSIDRKLVDLLLAVEDTHSVTKACERLSYSTRYAQRMMKRFTERSGIELLKHRGQWGSELTDGARECIALYVAARSCSEQLIRTHDFSRALPPLTNYPSSKDWNHKRV